MAADTRSHVREVSARLDEMASNTKDLRQRTTEVLATVEKENCLNIPQVWIFNVLGNCFEFNFLLQSLRLRTKYDASLKNTAHSFLSRNRFRFSISSPFIIPLTHHQEVSLRLCADNPSIKTVTKMASLVKNRLVKERHEVATKVKSLDHLPLEDVVKSIFSSSVECRCAFHMRGSRLIAYLFIRLPAGLITWQWCWS